VHFVNICVKNKKYTHFSFSLLCMVAPICFGITFPSSGSVPSASYERCSIEEQSIKYCGWACCV
jgi:hypothetical protein